MRKKLPTELTSVVVHCVFVLLAADACSSEGRSPGGRSTTETADVAEAEAAPMPCPAQSQQAPVA